MSGASAPVGGPRRLDGDDGPLTRDPRRLRTRWVWLLVIPFFWLARPTVVLLAAGTGLAILGLLLRAWAAGTIRKDAALATGGPYAHTRNPLYLGSFLIGAGVTLAGGHWIWPALFAAFYLVAYGRTLRYEEDVLAELFGDAFERYRRAVPAVWPRLTPYRAEDGPHAEGFALRRYLRHNEWEALLGALAAFAILAWKVGSG